MEVTFFYLQQKYYIDPVPDVFDCEMRGRGDQQTIGGN